MIVGEDEKIRMRSRARAVQARMADAAVENYLRREVAVGGEARLRDMVEKVCWNHKLMQAAGCAE